MLHPDTELRTVSDVVGYGVFATGRIPRGTITWVLDPLDQVLDEARASQIFPTLGHVLERFGRTAQGRRILCWDFARYMNHSSEANSFSPGGFDFEIAVRDVEPGEQLTSDYGSLNLESALACACGSSGCRGLVQLFSTMEPALSPVEAIAHLAEMTGRYRDMFSERARQTGLFKVGGSHPVRVESGIRNTAHLFTPDGGVYTQEKLHVTPNERREYGIEPGEGLKLFETSHTRLAILVCYDVEFPELARLLTLAGAEVLFVPFSTDERKAYLRVRYTAQARAVENVVYTVLSGNVGNLPQVENFLINYGEAAICTPSDFPFPTDAVAGRADFNSETVVITDLDLVTLEEVREMGSVRPLRDRRSDLYTLQSRTPVEIVRVS